MHFARVVDVRHLVGICPRRIHLLSIYRLQQIGPDKTPRS